MVAAGKDLDALKAPLRPKFAEAMAEAASESGLDVTGQTTWTFGTVERTFTQTRAGHEVRGFPALVDEGVRRCPWLSERRRLRCPRPSRRPRTGSACAGCSRWPLPSPVRRSPTACQRRQARARRRRRTPRSGPARGLCRSRPSTRWWTGTAWSGTSRRSAALRHSAGRTSRTPRGWSCRTCSGARGHGGTWTRLLSGSAEMSMLPALADMKAQVGRLVHRGFVSDVGAAQLRQLPRYLAAARTRRERLPAPIGNGPAADGPVLRPPGGVPAPARGAPRGTGRPVPG